MTPEERARKILDFMDIETDEFGLADAIREAIAEEREACARIADEREVDVDRDYCRVDHGIAAAIRARTT